MNILEDLIVRLGLKSEGFNSGIDKAKDKTSSFASSVGKLGGIIGAAFSVGAIISFGKELFEIGRVATGVKNAFDRIADPQILRNLEKATKGTVSQLELMKQAVMAQNLGVPIKNLAGLLEFASKRAQDTGQSVDYLVNSIVTGIGRKSPLILDNLGISAIELNKRLGVVSIGMATVGEVAEAVGKIASEAMEKSGAMIEDNGVKAEQAAVKWMNLKTSMGQLVNESWLVSKVLGQINNDLAIANSQLPWYEKFWYRLTQQYSKGAKRAEEYEEALAEQNKTTDEANKLNEEFGNLLGEININAAENNKLWEKKFELWNKLNDAYVKGLELTDLISDSLRAQTKALKEATSGVSDYMDAWTQPKQKEAHGVGENDVFSMFKQEKEIDLGFDTEAYLEQWTEFGEILADTIQEAISVGADILEDTFAAIFSGDGLDIESLGKNMLSKIGKFLGQFGKMLIAYGVAQEAFWTSLAGGPVGAGTAIAAGLALVAIGGAIQGIGGSVSKGNLSTGGGGVVISSSAITASDNTGSSEVTAILKGDSLYLANQRNMFKRGVIG